MKKIVLFLCIALVFCFASCSDSEQNEALEVELVQLSNTNMILYEGQSFALSARAFPENADSPEFYWSTSQPEICSVEGGLITAHKQGIAVITAKTANGKSASVKVEVKPIEEIKSIAMTELKLELETGESHTLSALLNPASASSVFPVVWSSSDPEVAKVDQSGNVLAVGEGHCLITAEIPGFLRAVSEVTVSMPAVDVDEDEDLSLLVDASVRGVPGSFDCKDTLGRILSSFELSSYDVTRELTADGVTVTFLIYGVKTFDAEGENATNPVGIDMDLFMEDDEFCDEWLLKSGRARVGEEIVFEFKFNAVIKPDQRIFYAVLREEGSERAE